MPSEELKNLSIALANGETPTGTGLTSDQGTTAISSDTLSETSTPVDIPEPNITNRAAETFTNDIADDVSARQATSDLAAETEQRRKDLESKMKSSEEDFLTSILESPTLSDFEMQAAEAYGFDEKTLAVKNIDHQILTEQDRLRTQIENIQRDGGGLKIGAQSEIANLERESLAKQADLSLTLMAAQDQLEYASTKMERAANAMWQRQQQINNYRKDLVDRNRDLFDAAELRDFDLRMRQEEQRQANEREDFLILQNAKIEAMKMANMNDAPQDVINAISTAQTPSEVLSVAGRYGSVDLIERQIKNQQLANAVKEGRMKDYEITLLEAAEERRNAAIEAGELLPEQYEEVDKIDKEFRSEPIVKEFNEASAKRFAVNEVVENGVKGVEDMLLVYEFMKAVDPTSVVRESEFQNAAETGNIFAGKFTKYNEGYFGEGGFLPPEVQASFLNSMNASWSGKQKMYFNIKDEYGKKVDRRFGTQNGQSYLTSYEDAAPLDTAASIDTAKPGQIIIQNGIKYIIQEGGTAKQITD